MSRAIHCDARDCETWALEGHFTSAGWIKVTEDGTVIGDYCFGWHAVQNLAETFGPPIVVSA